MNDGQINVDIKRLNAFTCKCGGTVFFQVYSLKFLPGMLIGQRLNAVVPVQEWRCSECLELIKDEDVQNFKQ